jgi:hypothetical protein
MKNLSPKMRPQCIKMYKLNSLLFSTKCLSTNPPWNLDHERRSPNKKQDAGEWVSRDWLQGQRRHGAGNALRSSQGKSRKSQEITEMKILEITENHWKSQSDVGKIVFFYIMVSFVKLQQYRKITYIVNRFLSGKNMIVLLNGDHIPDSPFSLVDVCVCVFWLLFFL